MISRKQRLALIVISVAVIAMLCAYSAFMFVMRGMAHSDNNEQFAELMGFGVLAYVVIGLLLLIAFLKGRSERKFAIVLAIWNGVPILAFAGALPFLI